MGHEFEHFSAAITVSQQLPLYYRWGGCSSSCPSRLCVPTGERRAGDIKCNSYSKVGIFQSQIFIWEANLAKFLKEDTQEKIMLF